MFRCIAAALLVLLLAGVAPARAGDDPTVILLSLDGVRHDYLDRDRERLPALTRIAREGARAAALVPVFPSSTFPSHVSLATGTYPDRHGIVANRFHDPARPPEVAEFDYSNDADWIQAEPLWIAAERQGVRSAAFFWVGSETDWPHGGSVRRATHRRAPFDGSVPESEKTDQILAWLDLPPAERPRLILSWWHGADAAGHRFGPDAEETRRQLAGQDHELARLLAGLDARGAWATTTLLVVSDHGMVGVEEALDLRAPLDDAGVEARVVPFGSVAHVFLAAPTPARVEKARGALAAVPGVRAYALAELPESLRYAHPTRVGHVVALSDPPRFFSDRWSLRDARFRISRLIGGTHGGHGYEPDRLLDASGRSPMDGIFLARGRGVTAGHAPGRVRAVDVAATVAGLLGIEPPRHSEGRPIPLR